MAEQALYRKYRSASFDQVVGQEHVTRTLATAIEHGRVSHAYLFAGPRGVGKTSVARLLARALNCTGSVPAAQMPCNTCANCAAEINSSLDIVEIDAASNNGVDDVRELREKISLAPTLGRHKVYIIDEVHMLSTGAFNALLKTLEEPPAHAVFILATTEVHKLPETIISRTQRFDFKPISSAAISAHLEIIAGDEKIEIEPGALQAIAVAARGGFRDAIGMLDQMAASGQTPITAQAVQEMMGLSDPAAIGAISRAVADHNAKAAIEALEQVIEQGAQPGQVAAQLVAQWRGALLAAVGAAAQAEGVAADLSQSLTTHEIARAVEALLEAARSHWPREALEVAIVRLAAATTGETVPSAEPKRAAARPAPAEPVATKAPDAVPTVAGSAMDGQLWPKVLVILKQKNNSLCALLQMYPVEFGDDAITIQSRFNFHRDLFNKPANRQVIETAVQKVYGRPIAVAAVTNELAAPAKRPAAPDSGSELVSSALEILGGEIVD